MKKKVLTTAFLAMFSLAGKAQAPDFTATDINGNSWHLYELLGQGKTVILDFSATWCNPCWDYHHEEVLSHLYQTFGPDGSDQLMVFLVESDPSTTMADLNGTGSNTQGDWITGTPYPILDQTGVEDLYPVPGFPTLYTICPDGSYDQTNRQTFDEYVNTLLTQCSNSIAGSTDVIATPVIGDLTYDQGCGSISPKIDVMNIGVNDVTSATIELKINGVVVETQNGSGTLTTGNRGTFYFDTYPVNEGDLVEITITQVNGGADDVPGNNTWSYTIEGIAPTIISSNQLTVEFRTDTTPEESTWSFKSTDGTVIASGGPYSLANNLYTVPITLPGDGCYQFGVYDSWGDGLYPVGAYYKLLSGTEVLAEGVEFEYLVEYLFNFEVQTSGGGGGGGGSAAVEDLSKNHFAIYPNPTKGKVEIKVPYNGVPTNISVTNANGKEIEFNSIQDINDSKTTVDLSGNAPGIYFLKIVNGTEVAVERIVLQ